jgi:hypothetical protein
MGESDEQTICNILGCVFNCDISNFMGVIKMKHVNFQGIAIGCLLSFCWFALMFNFWDLLTR